MTEKLQCVGGPHHGRLVDVIGGRDHVEVVDYPTVSDAPVALGAGVDPRNAVFLTRSIYMVRSIHHGETKTRFLTPPNVTVEEALSILLMHTRAWV